MSHPPRIDPHTASPADPPQAAPQPSWLKRLVLAGEARWSRAGGWFRKRNRGRDHDYAPEVYRALRHNHGTNVWGRVLRIRTFRKASLTDSGLINFLRMVRRWMTREYAGVVVRATCGNSAAAAVTDEEGYFEIELRSKGESADEPLYVSLPGHPGESARRVDVITPGAQARCLVVSDIDDTIILSNAHRFPTMVRTTIFGNVLTRQLHPGVASLYRALAGERSPQNIVAYVTSSPWNLHGLISRVFARAGMPVGPFFMTDWGLNREQWLTTSHHEHKMDAVERLLDWIKDIPVLLIGDSGQKDAEIYRELARRHPGRIASILIRAVGGRSEADGSGAHEAGSCPCPFHLFRDSGEAAVVLQREGWIDASQRKQVQEEVAAGIEPAGAPVAPLDSR